MKSTGHSWIFAIAAALVLAGVVHHRRRLVQSSREAALDEALDESFPASDSPSFSWPR